MCDGEPLVMTDTTEHDTRPEVDQANVFSASVTTRDPGAQYWKNAYEAACRREEQIAQVLQETRNSYVEARAECDKLRAIKNELAAEVEEAFELLHAAEEERDAYLRTIARMTQMFVTDEVGYSICEDYEEEAN